jgi:hypothetical protein
MLTGGRKKLNVLEWPFPQVPLAEIEYQVKSRNPKLPAAIHDPVPADVLTQLPPSWETSAPNPDHRYTYVRDAGELYRVTRLCRDDPRCDTFDRLTVLRVRPALPTLPSLYSAGGLFWPTELGIDLAQVGPEGRHVPTEQYERHRLFYDKLAAWVLVGGGYNFIHDDHLYERVRVCRVDPDAKPSPCVTPNAEAR